MFFQWRRVEKTWKRKSIKAWKCFLKHNFWWPLGGGNEYPEHSLTLKLYFVWEETEKLTFQKWMKMKLLGDNFNISVYFVTF